MEFGVGMGMAAGNGAATIPAYMYGIPAAMETLRVDDLLDFAGDELFSPSSSTASDIKHLPDEKFTPSAAVSSSHAYYQRNAFADDMYIPSDEVEELEWLSKFVEDSFSDVPLHSPATQPTAALPSEASAIGRGSRSKRSRGIISGDPTSVWSSLTPSSSVSSSSSSSDFPTPKNLSKKKQASAMAGLPDVGGIRRCTHCSGEKTPQWRTGPLGPKTLCNACGVRFKSGRLVPEYRPAASPSFVLAQHSNSHRKVLELRRQKELLENRTDVIYRDYDVRSRLF